jgi:hypothetical protein
VFEIVVEQETIPLLALYSFIACVFVCASARVCKPLFVFSEGHGMKALTSGVPRRAVELKKEEADPVSARSKA